MKRSLAKPLLALIMNKKNKKIIASEFLYMLGAIIMFFLVYTIWIVLVHSNENKVSKIEQEIEKLKEVDYLTPLYSDPKKNGLIEPKTNFIEFTKITSTQIDSLYKYSLEKKVVSKLTSLTLFKSAWENYPNYKIKLILLKEKKVLLKKLKESFFNDSIGTVELNWLGIIIFSLFFILRYLIQGTKWSMKQLKE